MQFQELVEIYEQLEKTASNLEMYTLLADFYKKVKHEEIDIITYLTLGKIASDYQSVVLGLAEKSVLKAIAKTAGISEKKVKELLHKKGDAGLVAEEVLKKKPQTLIPVGKLEVKEFYDGLHKLAKMSGSGSQDQKTNVLVSLLQKTSPTGGKYFIRIVLGTLRMGVGDMTVLNALSLAFTGDRKSKDQLEKAHNICPDVGLIAKVIAKSGVKGLEKIDVQIGRPIRMMLAQRVSDLSDVQKKMPGNVSVEGKYDGERVQAHKSKDEINLFSRRLDNITHQFPDLVEYLKKIKGEFIVEGEILAFDEKGKLLPFQTLMQRRRKHDIEDYVTKIPVKLKCFELLYLDGKIFLHEEYKDRVKALEKLIGDGNSDRGIILAERIETDDLEKIEQFFQKMLKVGNEGIMIKALDGEYQAGTRGWNWIKWKKEYVKDLIDTFDLVVVGAYFGRGRRSGVYGALLCAAYDDEEDRYETVCKLGTGLTDEMLSSLPDKFSKLQVEKKPINVAVKKEMEPDVWFSPEVVVEVLAAEITKSPFHTAGYALRFPRFVRFREDKKAEQATTIDEISEV